MHRLLQGDVGSGKTVVAALAALRTVENGLQAAVMAPTEILAEQHYRKFSEWLAPLGVQLGWLSGGQKKKERAAAAADIASGKQKLDGRLLMRARLYAKAARGTFEQMRRRWQRDDNGMTEERRALGPDRHAIPPSFPANLSKPPRART